MDETTKIPLRPLVWTGSAHKDLSEFPAPVKREVGFALYMAQAGKKHDAAKPLKGYGDASVMEIVSSFDGDAFRTVYTVRFERAIYVLHAFQKKSKSGSAMPMADVELIGKRLKAAREHYDTFFGGKK